MKSHFYLKSFKINQYPFALVRPLPIHNHVTPYSTPFNNFLLSLGQSQQFLMRSIRHCSILPLPSSLASAHIPKIPSILDSFPQNPLVLYTSRVGRWRRMKKSSRQGFPGLSSPQFGILLCPACSWPLRLIALIITVITALGELLSVCQSS